MAVIEKPIQKIANNSRFFIAGTSLQGTTYRCDNGRNPGRIHHRVHRQQDGNRRNGCLSCASSPTSCDDRRHTQRQCVHHVARSWSADCGRISINPRQQGCGKTRSRCRICRRDCHHPGDSRRSWILYPRIVASDDNRRTRYCCAHPAVGTASGHGQKEAHPTSLSPYDSRCIVRRVDVHADHLRGDNRYIRSLGTQPALTLNGSPYTQGRRANHST